MVKWVSALSDRIPPNLRISAQKSAFPNYHS